MLRNVNRTAGTPLAAALAVLVIAAGSVAGSSLAAGAPAGAGAAAGGPAAGAGAVRQLAGAAPTTVPPTTAPPTHPGVAPARTIWEFKGVQLATAWATGSRTWVDVPGGTTAFSPVAGSSATFNAVFSGETLCAGDATTWCSFRAVVVAPTGVSELKPAAGADFVLATAGAPAGNQSVQRTADGFPGGVGYTIKAQVAVIGTGTLTLDDWDFTVTMIT
ncbi:MAG: hypothetical protein V7637_587 [Mycobacteriales bacterium]|jgi:hypothetical protein